MSKAYTAENWAGVITGHAKLVQNSQGAEMMNV